MMTSSSSRALSSSSRLIAPDPDSARAFTATSTTVAVIARSAATKQSSGRRASPYVLLDCFPPGFDQGLDPGVAMTGLIRLQIILSRGRFPDDVGCRAQAILGSPNGASIARLSPRRRDGTPQPSLRA